MKTVTWLGETICDFCNADLKTDSKDFFVDGKTILGPWGLMCSKHFAQYGIGLGTGKGQKYNSKTLEKIC
jgi:hypothetical protein